MKITDTLAEFLVKTSLEDIPELPRETAKLCLLDWLGVTLAGYREPLGHILFDLSQALGGKPQASLVGRGTKTSVLNAALVNGSVSHALDYDDVHLNMFGHPTVPVAPAAFALGEWRRVPGRKLLEAFCLGFEAECRISAGVFPNHYREGFHATGTLGTFGAAVASAKILGLDRDRMVRALGLAGTQAAGLRQVFGTMAKPFHAGKAAMNGLLAALLAEKGFTCSTEILEGQMGFSTSLASECHPEKILEGLGEHFEVTDVQFKWHASCFQTHPAIDATLALTEKPRIGEIERIILTLHPGCKQVANIEVPRTGLEGKFSIPYCVALALATGQTDETQFTDEMVRQPDISALLPKVVVVDDDGAMTHLGRIQITTRDGKRVEAEANTLTLAQDPVVRKAKVEEKFFHLAEPILGKDKTSGLFERIRALEALPDVTRLAELWAV
jgi:2-methylcitrate dehydratase PrpD